MFGPSAKSSLILLGALALGSCGSAEEEMEIGADSIARAQLTAADGTSHGEVIVAEGDGGLIVRIDATGFAPGAKGVHIHAIGQCDGPDFKSAGGHWNPEGKQHGFDNPEGAHKGDFVNLDIGPDGTGMLESTIEGTTLKDGANALLDEDGAAFVVHEGPDDLVTDPSGDSGGRIACGVFALQKYKVAD
ncbi:MAG: superoxide dismutase family protein [Pseudomonadota bacterium]